MSRRIATLFCILALGLALGGCDKCGNWFGSQLSSGLQSCKDDTRR
jgi:hypothetical protein